MTTANGEGHRLIKYLYIAFNPADQLGYSAVDAGFIASTAPLSPAHHPGQPPVAAGRLAHQGSPAVSLRTGPNQLSSILQAEFGMVQIWWGVNYCRMSVSGGCVDLAGVHSSSHDAGADHPRSQVPAVDAGVGADGLSYDFDLSLPQLVSHGAWQRKKRVKDKSERIEMMQRKSFCVARNDSDRLMAAIPMRFFFFYSFCRLFSFQSWVFFKKSTCLF